MSTKLTREAEEAIEQAVFELEDILRQHRESTEIAHISGPERLEPIVEDEHGVMRFRANAIVRYLLDNGGIDLNQIAVQGFPAEEQQHFAQLIGYSVDGYSCLSYVSTKSIKAAREACPKARGED